MKKHSLGRTIASVIAVILILTGIYFLFESYRYRQKFYEWLNAEPINIAVDLSKPGKFSGKFHQTCYVAHGEELLLQVPFDQLKGVSPKTLIEPLEYHCAITDANGEVVVSSETASQIDLRDEYEDGAIPLLYFVPFKNGIYNLELEVTSGIPDLAGVPQRIIARYCLCGLELMAARVVMVCGIAALLVAGIIVLVLVFGKKQRREQGDQSKDTLDSP